MKAHEQNRTWMTLKAPHVYRKKRSGWDYLVVQASFSKATNAAINTRGGGVGIATFWPLPAAALVSGIPCLSVGLQEHMHERKVRRAKLANVSETPPPQKRDEGRVRDCTYGAWRRCDHGAMRGNHAEERGHCRSNGNRMGFHQK